MHRRPLKGTIRFTFLKDDKMIGSRDKFKVAKIGRAVRKFQTRDKGVHTGRQNIISCY